MEKCEKLTPDIRYDKMSERLYHPHHAERETNSSFPSPPERDLPKPRLTKADLEEYARSYQEPPTGQIHLTESELEDFMKYSSGTYEDSFKHHEVTHQKQLSYAQSEGYHSYVSSTDSTSTPFLDRLRRDSEAVVRSHASWDDLSEKRREGRDSVVTTSSGSASSSETLKWHGSMSDVSVASSGSCMQHAAAAAANSKQLIAHSAKVQTPQRHHSESVLYIGGESQDGWKDRESRNNNANKLKLFAVNTYTMQESGGSKGCSGTGSGNR